MRVKATLLALGCALALPAIAQDYPKMKPGQWDSTTSSSRAAGGQPTKITMCTDEAIQKQMMDMGKGMQKDMCSKMDMRHEGSKFIGDSVCKINQSTMTSHSVMTLSGDTAYKTVIDTTYDPPFMNMKESTTTVEGKYIGPCRDGMQPGDIMMPDGRKMNMKAMQGQTPMAPPAKAK